MRLRVEPPRAGTECYSEPTGPPPPGDANRLAVAVPPQARSNWCWAALASGLAGYYHGEVRSQAGIAEAVLRDATASSVGDGPIGADLNLEACLVEALSRVGCFSHWSPDRPTFPRLRLEIDRGRPVCARIQWIDGRSHFVLVSGYTAGLEEIDVGDPAYGPSLQAFATFPGLYQGQRAFWRETYWTAKGGADAPSGRRGG